MLESLRNQVRAEVRKHMRTNPAIQQFRRPFLTQLLFRILRADRLLPLIALYALLSILLPVAETAAVNACLPVVFRIYEISLDDHTLREINSYLLSAQAVLVGLLFPIAVGLVTLIIQRRNAATTADVRVYYSESLAYQIGASCLALLLVITIQFFWPLDRIATLSIGTTTLGVSKSVLTAIHLFWTALNLSAMWHFLKVSLSFISTEDRARLRKQYAATSAIPSEIQYRLLAANYQQLSDKLESNPKATPGVKFYFGRSMGSFANDEIASKNLFGKQLWDVWIGPLRWAARSWQRRCAATSEASNKDTIGPMLVFTSEFRFPVGRDGVFCRRRGGVPLNRTERLLLKLAMRHRRATE